MERTGRLQLVKMRCSERTVKKNFISRAGRWIYGLLCASRLPMQVPTAILFGAIETEESATCADIHRNQQAMLAVRRNLEPVTCVG
jgi:hypothetical protein